MVILGVASEVKAVFFDLREARDESLVISTHLSLSLSLVWKEGPENGIEM